MPFSTTLNNDNASTNPHHRRYHELCGHVHATVTMKYVKLLKFMLENIMSSYPDGVLEGALGVISGLISSLEMTLVSFSYGGMNVLTEGRNIARRQVNFAKSKMQARRTGWDITRYRKEGHHHLTSESLIAIRNIIEYEDEIEGSHLYYG